MVNFRILLCCATLTGLLAMSSAVAADQQGSNRKKQEPQEQEPSDVESSIGKGAITEMRFVDDDKHGVAGKTKKGFHRNSKKSVTDTNGKRTVTFDKLPSGVMVSVARLYDPEDHANLIGKHPELSDYIEMFPKEIDGSQITMAFSITTKYQAKNLVELKEKHPDAYDLYQRYFKKASRTNKAKKTK